MAFVKNNQNLNGFFVVVLYQISLVFVFYQSYPLTEIKELNKYKSLLQKRNNDPLPQQFSNTQKQNFQFFVADTFGMYRHITICFLSFLFFRH